MDITYWQLFWGGAAAGVGWTLAQIFVRMLVWRYMWHITSMFNFPLRAGGKKTYASDS